MQLTSTILQYITEHKDEALALLLELAQIPAPSNHEEVRAEFCRAWLEAQGAENVYIDDALNVIYPIGCTDNNPLAVFMAHSDVVFPDTSSLPLTVDGVKIKCPGIGDDSANVAALLMTAKYIAQHGLTPRGMGVLIVVNSGEEGLGNLKGSRRIMESFGSRTKEFISFDSCSNGGVNRAVGSKRYRIEVDTAGGHSYGDFGNPSAIAHLASMINALYAVKTPPGGKTTFNVGTVSGGTSVNTIAQHAEMLYEYRSDEASSLAVMEQHLNGVIDNCRNQGVKVTLTCVGDRPCGGAADSRKMTELMTRANEAHMRSYGQNITFGPGSTDCNIPLSMGIPAICVGCCRGSSMHTREEYVEADSLLPGLIFSHELVLHHF